MGMVLSEISLSDTFNHAHGVSMHMGERCVTHWVRGTFAPFRFSIVPRLAAGRELFCKRFGGFRKTSYLCNRYINI